MREKYAREETLCFFHLPSLKDHLGNISLFPLIDYACVEEKGLEKAVGFFFIFL